MMKKKKMNSLLFSFADFRLPDPSVGWVDGSVGLYHTLSLLSSIFSHRRKFFRSVRPADSVGLYHIFGGLSSKKQQQQKKFFCQDESAFIVKFFTEKIFDFSILPDRGGFVKYFFQKQQKIFCQVKVYESVYKKKKKKKK